MNSTTMHTHSLHLRLLKMMATIITSINQGWLIIVDANMSQQSITLRAYHLITIDIITFRGNMCTYKVMDQVFGI